MKRKLALFLALCTLSGCANTAPAATTTSETSETTSVTTEITTPPPVTTTAQVTTAVTDKAPQKYEGDMPELTAKNIPYTIEKRVRIDDLLGQIDIKPQIDITTLDMYDNAVNYFENYATEEEKALLIPDCYMYYYANLEYMGTEDADWLLHIDYYFGVGAGLHIPSHSRFFKVKDGIVTEEIISDEFLNFSISKNTADYLYITVRGNDTTGGGIYQFDKKTTELQQIIPGDGWLSFLAEDNNYIIYSYEGIIQIYNKESKEISITPIPYDNYEFDVTRVLYNGEVLYYSEDSKYYCYDIATGETSELSQFGVAAANRDYPWDIIAGNSDIGKYHINTKYRTDKLVSMTVTVRESGTERKYIFEEIAQNFLNDGCVRANLRGEAYGMLCFTIDTYTGSYLFLLDPERNTIQYFNADETDTFFLSAVADTLICYTDSGYYTVVPEIKYEKADLFPDEELYPVPSDKVTEVLFAEKIWIEKFSEQDFPDKEHLRLAKEAYWADEAAQKEIAKYNSSSYREENKYEKIESVENLRLRDGYYYDFDMDGENESIVAISYSVDYIQTAYCYYVDNGKAQNLGKCESLGMEIYDFGNALCAQISFLFGATFYSGNIYKFSDGEAKVVSGNNEAGEVVYKNGFFVHYQKYEQLHYPVICCADGVFRQTGREEITREDFEKHVKNGAEYLNKLEAQYISINKIETWGHYTYQLSCTERGADFGINICMSDDEAAYIRVPYKVANEPKLTEEQIYGVDVWNLKDASAIVPEVSFDNNVSKEKSFVHSDIETQLRTEKPVDASVYDWYDEIRAEAEEKGGEEAENAKKNNYTSIYILNSKFIGNEKADWIVSALYYPRTGGLIPPFLCRIFYVKDGKITQYLAEFESDCYIASYDGRIFASAFNNGIYELNLKTDKLEKIVDATIISDEWPHQNFCRCLAATNEYMIYKDAEECLKIYYFASGKILKTDIYSGWQDGQAFGIHGDSLIYMPMNTDSNEYAELDVMTGELGTSDISHEEFWNLLSDFKNESDSHLIEPFYPYNGLPNIITVKSKTDGKIKKFDMKTVLEQLGYKLYSFYALGVDGNKLYCYSSSEKCCLVINLSQDTMRVINLEGSRYSISVSFDSSQIEVYDGKQNYILKIKS